MSFKRKVGAAADIKELEYIIALHQTCMPDTRENATVSSIDVMYLLKSRYALNISHQEAIDVVAALGGGDNIVREKNQARQDKKEFIHFFRKNPGSGGKETQEAELSPTESNPDGMADHGKLGTDEVDMLMQENGADHFDEEQDHFAEQKSAGAAACGGTPESKEDGSERKNGRNLQEIYLDMVQILSLLFIPSIACVADDFWHPKPPPVPPSEPTGWAIKVFSIRRLRQLKSWAINQFSPAPHLRAGIVLHDVRNILMREFLPETVVDAAFVEKLLLKNGEYERAQNPRLIREMVEAARSSSGTFDDEAFINALSSDLEHWDVDGDERMSTFFYDVFGTENFAEVERLEAEDPRELGGDDSGVDEEADNPGEKSCHGVCSKKKKSYLFKPGTYNIDLVVDTHLSLINAVGIWAFYLFSVGLCSPLILATPVVETSCDIELMWCYLLSTIYSW
jgi:hypothetical protein